MASVVISIASTSNTSTLLDFTMFGMPNIASFLLQIYAIYLRDGSFTSFTIVVDKKIRFL